MDQGPLAVFPPSPSVGFAIKTDLAVSDSDSDSFALVLCVIYAFLSSRLRPCSCSCSCSDAFSGLQGLLAVPFVLNSQPTAVYEEYDEVKSLQTMAQELHRRYAEIMRDVEGLVNDHSK